MREVIISGEVKCSPEEFYNIYREESFKRQYHARRGESNMRFTPWHVVPCLGHTTDDPEEEDATLLNQLYQHSRHYRKVYQGETDVDENDDHIDEYVEVEKRIFRFLAPIHASATLLKVIGKDTTDITEVMHVNRKGIHDSNFPIVYTEYDPGVLSNFFHIATYWYLKQTGENKCIMSVVVEAECTIYFLGKLFELFVINSGKEAVELYVNYCTEYFEEREQNLGKEISTGTEEHDHLPETSTPELEENHVHHENESIVDRSALERVPSTTNNRQNNGHEQVMKALDHVAEQVANLEMATTDWKEQQRHFYRSRMYSRKVRRLLKALDVVLYILPIPLFVAALVLYFRVVPRSMPSFLSSWLLSLFQ
eukprot:gb/GECH01004803.1/.p1 GENE.gb/GECH01004803.1/~~gb/GECH01004803.1/.p1  ORF type:complete len:367 (+),score=78.42 gb/GECH01004803.1/:1-1101(+)